MNFRTMMQAGPARANELFTRLADTSDGAVKTRERLFAELKSELELHASLEEQHLFPLLRKHAETRDLVAEAIRDNKELRAKLAELDGLPKNDESFGEKIAELKKTFRQHARDEKRELLPAVQRALSEEQVQDVAGRIENGFAEAEQAKQDEAEERRARARQEREQAEAQAEREQAESQAREAAARQAGETVRAVAGTATRTAEMAVGSVRLAGEVAADGARRMDTAVRETAETVRRVAESAPARIGLPGAGFFFWDWMLPGQGAQGNRFLRGNEAGRGASASVTRHEAGMEEVIPLGEEVLHVGKQMVNRGTTRVRRYVVETPTERQVSLRHERVVVERRRPVTDAATGETLTEKTVEVIETAEVPVVRKTTRVREEIIVRVEVTDQTETVRETLRHDEVDIEQPNHRQPRRRLANA